jgi:hypothetical protein
VTLTAMPVHAGPIEPLDITLDATVTRVTGGGSFTTSAPGGGTRVRTYRVSEIPNFYWQVAKSFTIKWRLSRAGRCYRTSARDVYAFQHIVQTNAAPPFFQAYRGSGAEPGLTMAVQRNTCVIGACYHRFTGGSSSTRLRSVLPVPIAEPGYTSVAA